MQPTAAIMIIGDEILNGRTADKNINYLASQFYDRGIKLAEARVIGDDEALIIETVRSLSEKYDHVFTSGGIGPTHDDITTVTIAKAFGVKVIRHPEADQRLIDVILFPGQRAIQHLRLNAEGLQLAHLELPNIHQVISLVI